VIFVKYSEMQGDLFLNIFSNHWKRIRNCSNGCRSFLTHRIRERISTALAATNSTVEGMEMVSSDDEENAYDSIRVKCEFDSNVIDENDL
jgi:hypothetical protein